eukprot:scpid73406/ scgid1007/ 
MYVMRAAWLTLSKRRDCVNSTVNTSADRHGCLVMQTRWNGFFLAAAHILTRSQPQQSDQRTDHSRYSNCSPRQTSQVVLGHDQNLNSIILGKLRRWCSAMIRISTA